MTNHEMHKSNAAAGLLTVPKALVGSAFGLARWGTKKVSGVVSSVAGTRPDDRPERPSEASSRAESTTPAKEPSTPAKEPDVPEKEPSTPATEPDANPTPVNVVEELGLDPAPVADPPPASPARTTPLTSIDAAADPSDVEVTPADIARVVERSPAEESDD